MSGTILLADDSLTIQKVVELTFADTDYRVVAVSSGDDLLDRMDPVAPDLIICDVIMPGKDGYEVCQQIKSSPDWLHLPVILLTGTFEPFDRDRAIAAGCSEIITKPFEAQKLVDTVERLIGSADGASQGDDLDDDMSFMAGDEEWPDEATPVDVPPERAPEPEPDAFGTRLSDADGGDDDGDGIEFTTSGFAEMEAAGRSDGDTGSAAPVEDGIDFEADDAAGTGFHAVEGDAPVEPPPPPPSPKTADAAAQTVKIDVSEFAVEQREPDAEPESPADRPEADEIPEARPDLSADQPETDETPETEPEPPVVPEKTDDTADGVAEPFAGVDEEPFEAAGDPAAVEAQPAISDEPSMADTSPIDPPGEPEESETGAAAGFELSEEDVDRIARRVVELASHRLDEIAWEIVPDMAEIVVRQRIRELEAEADTGAPESVQ